MMNIAALYTCHNRKEKTLASLRSLFSSTLVYNDSSKDKIELSVFLTDDGCTDDTAGAIRSSFPNNDIHIIQGNGELYWAGGMRVAWNAAIHSQIEWDYYLLLNDDTELKDECLIELFSAQSFCKSSYGRCGIISGITCSKDNPQLVTYGGDVLTNRLTGKSRRLNISGKPQMIDMTNANILLVPQTVVEEIGIFYERFQHGRADSDYALTARRHNIPVLITGDVCGYCENDHGNLRELRDKIIAMELDKRKAFFAHPLHSAQDYMLLVRCHFPVKYPMTVIFRFVNIYFPRLYYTITLRRLDN